jgi:hypothetical protein
MNSYAYISAGAALAAREILGVSRATLGGRSSGLRVTVAYTASVIASSSNGACTLQAWHQL